MEPASAAMVTQVARVGRRFALVNALGTEPAMWQQRNVSANWDGEVVTAVRLVALQVMMVLSVVDMAAATRWDNAIAVQALQVKHAVTRLAKRTAMAEGFASKKSATAVLDTPARPVNTEAAHGPVMAMASVMTANVSVKTAGVEKPAMNSIACMGNRTGPQTSASVTRAGRDLYAPRQSVPMPVAIMVCAPTLASALVIHTMRV